MTNFKDIEKYNEAQTTTIVILLRYIARGRPCVGGSQRTRTGLRQASADPSGLFHGERGNYSARVTSGLLPNLTWFLPPGAV